MFLLSHPVAALAVALPDKAAGVEVLVQKVGENLGGVTRLGEDDDALALLDAQRLGEQDVHPRELGVDLVVGLDVFHRLPNARVGDQSLIRLRRARRTGGVAKAVEIPL